MSLVQRSITPQQVEADGTLLDAQTTNTTGTWFPLGRIVPWSLTVRGTMGTATVTIFVSNQVVKPADADNLQAVFQATTTNTSMFSPAAFRWIKAGVTGAGGGTSITVDVMGGG